MRHHGGTSTGTPGASDGGGSSRSGVADQASVAGSRCANSTAAMLSAAVTPVVCVSAYGPTASMRSANLRHSAFSVGSVMSMPASSTCDDGSDVKSCDVVPSPTTTLPASLAAWHDKQFAVTTSTPLGCVNAVCPNGSVALCPSRPGSCSDAGAGPNTVE